MIQPPRTQITLDEDLNWRWQLELGASIHHLGEEPTAPRALQRWTAIATGYTAAAGDVAMPPRVWDLYQLLVNDLGNNDLHCKQRPPRIETPATSLRERAKFAVAMDHLSPED